MKIVLIRHLESIANVKRCYAGWTDVNLTQEGLEKGIKLRKLYGNLKLDEFLFVSSSLSRATKTMEILFPGKHYTKNDGLRETNFGIFEMKTYDELKDQEEYQKWISGNFVSNQAPLGESYLMMQDRVLKSFKKLLSLNKDLVIVTHAGPIGVIMRYIMNDINDNIFYYDCPNGLGYIIDYNKKDYTKISE